MIETLACFEAKHGTPVPWESDGYYTSGLSLGVLLALARWRRPMRFLEMYTGFGQTAVAVVSACPSAHVFTFDVCAEEGGWDKDSPFAREVSPRLEVAREVRAAPPEVARRVSALVGHGGRLPVEIAARGPYQMSYIDGDHTWRRVVEDTRLALLVTEDDGILVWDDYWPHCPDVMRFLDQLNSRCGDRLIMVEGARNCYVALDEAIRRSLMEAVSTLV